MAKTKFEVYKDKSGTYRWRLLSQNGESVAVGGEAYASKSGAMNAAKKLKDWSKTKDVVDVEKEKELVAKKAAKEKEAAQKAKAKKVASKAKVKKTKPSKTAKPNAKKVASKAKTKTNKVTKKTTSKKKVAKTESNKPNKIKTINMTETTEDKYDGMTISEAMQSGIDNGNETESLM